MCIDKIGFTVVGVCCLCGGASVGQNLRIDQHLILVQPVYPAISSVPQVHRNAVRSTLYPVDVAVVVGKRRFARLGPAARCGNHLDRHTFRCESSVCRRHYCRADVLVQDEPCCRNFGNARVRTRVIRPGVTSIVVLLL